MHVHEEVLRAANQLAGSRGDWTFQLNDVVRKLPHLNESTVRTHVVSRCCENAPKNHLHKWSYFFRVGRGRYQVQRKYRDTGRASPRAAKTGPSRGSSKPTRGTIHAVVRKDDDVYVVECLEIAVVTQGRSLDEAVVNVQEALALHLEGEDLAAMGLAPSPRLEIIYELPLAS
jgi:predicted RNase H-like HicB family nuclease